MGLSANRLSIDNTAKLNLTNFESTSDTNARLSSISYNELLDTKETPETGTVNPTTNILNDGLSSVINGVENGGCALAGGLFSAYDTVSSKIPKLDTALLKDLENDFSHLISGLKVNLSDYKLNMHGIGKLNINKGCSDKDTQARLEGIYNRVKSTKFPTSIISPNGEKYLNSVIQEALHGKLNLSGLAANDLNAITNRIKADLLAGTNLSGMTAKEKLALQQLFGNKAMLQNNLMTQAVGTVAGTGFIGKLLLKNLLAQTSKTNPNLSANMVSQLVSDPTQNRSNVMSALSKTVVTSDKNTVENNLMLMNAAVAANQDSSIAISDAAAMRTNTSGVLKAISSNGNVSNTSTSDYNNIMTGLNNIDPQWATDTNGNTNYSVVSDNSRMVNLATSVVSSQPADTTKLNQNEFNTNLSPSQTIAVLGSFNSSLATMDAKTCKCA